MWEVLGLLVRHQGRLKSSVPPSKKDDSSAEAQLAAVLVSLQDLLIAAPTPCRAPDLRCAVSIKASPSDRPFACWRAFA